MSELINKNDNRTTIRWKLLTGVSALALTANLSSVSLALAGDNSQPQIWIQLGGQLSGLEDAQEPFAPEIMDARPSIFAPSQEFEKSPRYSIDELGAISFQPENTNWIFSGAIRYGRSASNGSAHQQTNPKSAQETKYGQPFGGPPQQPLAARFASTNARNSERHLIADFQAGKDVGLGMFGQEGSSILSLGVRFAQFNAKSNAVLKSDPDWHFSYKYVIHANIPFQGYHTNIASLRASRDFHGVGPSIAWNASAPLAGNAQDGELDVDLGANAAILFGRQRTKVHHQTTAQHHPSSIKYVNYHGFHPITYQPTPVDRMRAKSVSVPNIGGSLGLSWRMQNFKMSLGYRADMFFEAIDGGIDARKEENRGFFGPFASLSVGVGD